MNAAIGRFRVALRKSGAQIFFAVLPRFLRGRFRHSLDKPFGDRYYLHRAKNYDADREGQQSWGAEYDAMAELAVHIGRKKTVLDVPVGSGRFFPIYEQAGWSITGLDLSRDMLQVARERALAPEYKRVPFLVTGKANNLPFPTNSFDVVVCFRFLQSIVDFRTAKEALTEFSRVSASFVVIHIDVGLGSATTPPKLKPKETMRGKLNWSQTKEFLASCDLEIVKRIGPMPSPGKNEHVLLCATKSQDVR